MRPTLPALLLCLAACGTQPQAKTAQPSVTSDTGSAGCGAAAHATGNEAEMDEACGLGPRTPADRRQTEISARSGHWEAMLLLAREAGSPAEAHRWYAAAMARGRCPAVRLLLATMFQDGQSDAEHRRWAAEDRRRGCSVHRWVTNADGSMAYSMPEDFGWKMWIGCVGRRIRITGVSGSAPNGRTQLLFRTSRGDQPRQVSRTEIAGRLVLVFDAGPDDEVLAALIRGERIEQRYLSEPDADVIDARGLRDRLVGLTRRCFGRA